MFAVRPRSHSSSAALSGGARACRTVAFLAGGVLPPSARGSTFGGVLSIADWYTTLCFLAGADPTDHQVSRLTFGFLQYSNYRPIVE